MSEQQTKVGDWRLVIVRDDAAETKMFDDPDSYTDVVSLQKEVLDGLRNQSLAAVDVLLQAAIPGGWEHVGGIGSVISYDFVDKTYSSLDAIDDEHLKDLAAGLLDEYEERLAVIRDGRPKHVEYGGHRLSNTGDSVGDNPDFKTFSPSTALFRCADCEQVAPMAAFRAINCKPDAVTLALLISTQSGEEGQPGSWDDSAVAMELAELVLKEHGLK